MLDKRLLFPAAADTISKGLKCSKFYCIFGLTAPVMSDKMVQLLEFRHEVTRRNKPPSF